MPISSEAMPVEEQCVGERYLKTRKGPTEEQQLRRSNSLRSNASYGGATAYGGGVFAEDRHLRRRNTC